MVERRIGFLEKNGLGAEIVLYDTNWVCNYPAQKVAEIGAQLREAGIALAVHGPIHDLNPGSLDEVVRDYTRHCYLKTMAICHALGAKALVLHLGLNPLLPDSALGEWLETSLRVWTPIVDMAEQMGLTIRLENMFDRSPEFLVSLRDGLNSDAVKICFDIGHFNVHGATSLDRWLDDAGDGLDEVHLNDNDGVDDSQLELGKGNVDFRGLFDSLSARGALPAFTIEIRKSDKLEGSLAYLDGNDFLAPFAEV
jgi:sugar phosphate isomerase/epimerase